MLQIDFSPSFKKIQEFATNYNAQFLQAKDSSSKQIAVGAGEKINDIRKMLRSSHITLMKRLVECLSSQINKSQKLHGPLDYSIMDDDMPHLITNNVCLAKSLSCTSKTVYNQLKRLELAGFISDRTFRGSRSDYKIKLNTACMQLILQGNPVLIPSVNNGVNNANTPYTDRIRIVQKPYINHNLHDQGKKKIHHTGEIKTIKSNNNNRSGEIVDKSTISGLLLAFKGTTTNQENPFGNRSELEKNYGLDYKTGAEHLKTPPPIAAPPPRT